MTYLGLDVLDGERHNAREAIAESFGRLGTLIENATGRREFDDHAGIALLARTFTWTARGHAAAQDLYDFLDARQGRLVPFWTPTFSWDLALAADAGAADAVLTIIAAGYGRFLYSSAARRHLAIFPPGGAPVLRHVTGLDLGAQTEVVHLDAAVGVDLPAATSRLCFLVLGRLAEDRTEVRWPVADVAEATIKFAEIPREIPS